MANSTVLGQGASITAGLTGSNVAIGQGSAATAAAVPTSGATIGGTAYTFAGATPAGVVSFGTAGNERQLTNVAAGQLSATSTDAVNGSQLFATNQQVTSNSTTINNIVNGGGIKYFHSNSTLPDSVATGTDSVAIGPNAVANNAGDIALGSGSVTAAANPTSGATIGGTAYTFAGATPTSVVSVGAVGAERQITNVAAGQLSATSTDAINGSQLFATNSQVTSNSTAITNIVNGGGIKYFHSNSTLPDSVATGTDSVAIGPNAVANNAKDVALGSGSVTAAAVGTAGTTLQGTAYTFAGATPTSTVSVGAVGAERTITNVAAGRISATSTDAINGSQLFATNTALNNIISGGGGIKYFHANSTDPDSVASGKNAVAAGPNAIASAASSVALGDGANASLGNSVALGAGSLTDVLVKGTANTKIAGTTYTFAGGAPVGTVSVGSKGNERTISNVAAGRLAADSTDAINGSQLFATNSAVETLNSTVNIINTGGGIKYFHSKSTLPDSVADGLNSVAVGPQANSVGENSVAVGNGAVANNTGDVALGSGSVTAAANPTAGTTINGKAYTFAGATPTSVVSVGSVGAERQITNVAAGQLNATSTDAVNGSQLFATNQAVESVQGTVNNINTKVENVVQYDVVDGKRTNSVTLIGGDINSPVVIHKVAAGTADTDAVNVSQLNQTASTTLNQANTYTDNRTAAAIQTANNYTDNKFNQLNSKLGNIQSEARQAAAIGLAAASLRYDDRPGKFSAAVGGGVWKGEGAFAFGVGYTSEDARLRTNLSGTVAGGSVGVGAGLSYTFN
ncbi:YadA-like family protein [Rhizobium rhizogenes]|uniref:YadA-like family protein n=1 Tax=Rhizobium rhizogenes TaxID=359 RepID=UPI00403FBF17